MTVPLSLDDLLLSLTSIAQDQGATLERTGALDPRLSAQFEDVYRQIKERFVKSRFPRDDA